MATTDYKGLSYTEKTKHWGRGYVSENWRPTNRSRKEQEGSIKRYTYGPYRVVPNSWRIEWSSGKRSKSDPNKFLYRSLTVWGTYEEARKILDLIVEHPRVSLKEANEIIAPYIEWVKGEGTGVRRRVIKGPVPDARMTPQVVKRYFIERDYWRMRVLDTLEAYRRYDD